MKEATLAQASHLLAMIKQKGVPAEQLQAIFESGLLADLLDANVDEVERDKFRKLLGLTPLKPKITVDITVDYDMTLEQMIAAAHCYRVNPDITPENFPLSGKDKRNLVAEVIHLNRSISSDGVMAELDKIGLRPGKIEELLAYGATPLGLQKKSPIVALGSSCTVGGIRYVAEFHSFFSSKRLLDLYRWDDGWDGIYRFLAFHKPACR